TSSSFNTGGTLCSMDVGDACNLYLSGFYTANVTSLVAGTTTLTRPGGATAYLVKQSLNCTVGIKESKDPALKINIAPNPNNGMFELYSEHVIKGEIILRNSLGQIVYSQVLDGINNKIS